MVIDVYMFHHVSTWWANDGPLRSSQEIGGTIPQPAPQNVIGFWKEMRIWSHLILDPICKRQLDWMRFEKMSQEDHHTDSLPKFQASHMHWLLHLELEAPGKEDRYHEVMLRGIY